MDTHRRSGLQQRTGWHRVRLRRGDDQIMMDMTSADNEIRSTAQQWFARLLAPNCSDMERARFEQWRASDPEHAMAYRQVQDIWQRSASMRNDPAIATALQEA